MSANLNIFEQLNNNSEGENFFEVINKPAQPTKFGKIEQVEPVQDKNIFESLNEQQKEEKNFGFLDTLRDVAEQVTTKGIAGIGGAYGNTLDAFGLQLKEGQQLPGQEARNKIQFDILEKMNRGEAPTFGELMLLSDDDDLLPSSARLPTSKELQGHIESATEIGEGKTPAGRIAGQGASFVGEGLAYPGGGLKTLATLGGAGIAGQSIREAGGPEALASGVEIGGSIIPSMISGKVNPSGITKAGKEAVDIAKAGRHIGLSEKQIAPLIQSEGKAAVLSKVARKGTRTKKLFSSIKESLGDSYKNIKDSVANYGNVNATNRQILIDKFTAIKTDLQKTLKASPDKEAAINFIGEAIDKVSKNGATPEELINFWQDINKSVKWNSIQGGKKSLTQLKEPILEVLTNVSPAAAKDFELTNQLYSKYAQISKKLKPDLVDAFVNKGELIAGASGALALATGNPFLLGSVLTESAARILGREMLINPYFQNIANKLVTNFNSASVKGVTDLTKQAQDYLARKHPEEDWSFLTQD